MFWSGVSKPLIALKNMTGNQIGLHMLEKEKRIFFSSCSFSLSLFTCLPVYQKNRVQLLVAALLSVFKKKSGGRMKPSSLSQLSGRWKLILALFLIVKLISLIFTMVVYYKSCIDKRFTKLSASTDFLKACVFKGFVYSLKYKYTYMIINSTK